MSVNENNPDLKKDKPYQLVIDHIKDDILNGVLKPGDRLPGERELAEQLGISRNSVREGLRILENMGVTASRHGAGHYVSLRSRRIWTRSCPRRLRRTGTSTTWRFTKR